MTQFSDVAYRLCLVMVTLASMVSLWITFFVKPPFPRNCGLSLYSYSFKPASVSLACMVGTFNFSDEDPVWHSLANCYQNGTVPITYY